MVQQDVAQILTPIFERVFSDNSFGFRPHRGAHGLFAKSEKGTPHGGPLSPLLANIYLNELDKELTRRGHHFVRYADDCNIYVKSQRAGERIMRSITQFLEKRLKVKVNPDKTKVGSPLRLKFLGFSLGVDHNGAYACPAKQS